MTMDREFVFIFENDKINQTTLQYSSLTCSSIIYRLHILLTNTTHILWTSTQ